MGCATSLLRNPCVVGNLRKQSSHGAWDTHVVGQNPEREGTCLSLHDLTPQVMRPHLTISYDSYQLQKQVYSPIRAS